MSTYITMKRECDGRQILNYKDNKCLNLTEIIIESALEANEENCQSRGVLTYKGFMRVIAHVAEEIRFSASYAFKEEEHFEAETFFGVTEVITALLLAAEEFDLDDRIKFIIT